MRLRLRWLAAVLAGLLMLVACSANGVSPSAPHGSSGASRAGGDDGASATSSESETAVVASHNPATATSIATPWTGQTNSDGALENLLPDEIGGQPVEKGTMPGDRFLTSGLATPDLADYFDRLGVQPRTVSVSFAHTVAGPTRTGVFAFEVKGASQEDLMRAVTEARQAEIRGSAAWQSKVVGGKPTVTAVDASWTGGNAAYRYAAGDVVFFITAGHESTAAEVLASLP